MPFEPIRGRLGALVVAVLGACAHENPFRPERYTPDGPLAPGALARLTYNPGADRTPAWLPDGSEIVYSLERLDRRDQDRCLGFLPGTGGSLVRLACNRAARAADSVDVFEAPAPGPDGLLAYVRASSLVLPRSRAPAREELVVAPLARPTDARVLLPVGSLAPSGRFHEGVEQIRWLGPARLAYLAQRVAYVEPAPGVVDTVRWGLEIAVLDFTGPVPAVSIVSGTDGASSVALGATSDTIYFTRNGDARVFRRALTGVADDTVYDFGAGRIARDAQVSAGRLVAVVGGDVSYATDPVLGPVQRDAGGFLEVVDLATGVRTVLPDGGLRYRRPVVAPSGRALVAESVGPTGAGEDLWLVVLP